MQHVVKGYVIEAEKDGYFYHRTRGWVRYENPEQAFVWPIEDVESILESAKKNSHRWKLLPGKLHSATHHLPVKGYTTIDHPPIHPSDLNDVDIYDGLIIELERDELFQVSSAFIGSDMSL